MKVVGTFAACLAVLCLFVLWTEYAYQRGVAASLEMECDISAGQIN